MNAVRYGFARVPDFLANRMCSPSLKLNRISGLLANNLAKLNRFIKIHYCRLMLGITSKTTKSQTSFAISHFPVSFSQPLPLPRWPSVARSTWPTTWPSAASTPSCRWRTRSRSTSGPGSPTGCSSTRVRRTVTTWIHFFTDQFVLTLCLPVWSLWHPVASRFTRLLPGNEHDFLTLSLRDGGVALSVELGPGKLGAEVRPPSVRFDDNAWHHVVVKRRASEVGAAAVPWAWLILGAFAYYVPPHDDCVDGRSATKKVCHFGICQNSKKICLKKYTYAIPNI